MTKETTNHPLQDFYQDIYGRYDLVNRIFTFGRDKHWRSKAVNECMLNAPQKLLDICTGTGDLAIEMAEKAAKANVSGYDFTAEMLQVAREKSTALSNIPEFIQGDVADMPFENAAFDTAGISFGIRNLVYENTNADQHLSEIHRVIRDYGRFVILESSRPENAIWRLFNGIYLRFFLPYLGGLISGNLKAYRYLARSSKNYYSKTEMGGILEKAGFTIVRSSSLFLGSVMLIVAEKQPISNQN